MKQQDIFNKASAHLRSMDGPSLDDRGDSCMYRGEDGAMCAVGVFISDEHYFTDMEGGGIDGSNMRAREAVALILGLRIELDAASSLAFAWMIYRPRMTEVRGAMIGQIILGYLWSEFA